jgi:hypothetical protein
MSKDRPRKVYRSESDIVMDPNKSWIILLLHTQGYLLVMAEPILCLGKTRPVSKAVNELSSIQVLLPYSWVNGDNGARKQ